VYVNIIEPLVRLDENMQPVPVLAEKWDVVSDTRLRFYLKQGVTFHDGTPFNAEAVRLTLERALKGTTRARWATLVGSLDRAEVVDEHTVDIVFNTPYGPSLFTIAMPYLGIISPTAATKYGDDYGRNPVGTGPFKFVEWRTNDRIVLERFDGYWGEKAHLDKVIFRVIPEENSRMMALETGEVQMVLNPAPSALDALKRDQRFTVHQVTGLRVYFVGFNCAMEPVNDPLVRRALANAINTDEIVSHILEGGATKATGYISPGVFGFHDTNLASRYQYDPMRAQALLAEAGWIKDAQGFLVKDGKRMTLKMLGYRGRFLKDGETIEAVQAYLRNLGVDITVDWLEWGAAFEAMRSDPMPYHLILSGWVTTNADADYSLYGLFKSDQRPPAGWNRFRYANPVYDELVNRARVSLDQDERAQLYAQAQEVLVEATPLIPIYNTLETVVTTANVKGFVVHPVEYNLFLNSVWLEKR
jgi:peptide/nickel transport system substrate-binding protein